MVAHPGIKSTILRDKAKEQLKEEGWSVYETQHDFPELFCVKDGTTKLVKVPRETENMERPRQKAIIKELIEKGVHVQVIDRPQKNRDHLGGRLIKTISYKSSDIIYFEKLTSILRIQGKTFNEWVQEQTFDYVANMMKQVG